MRRLNRAMDPQRRLTVSAAIFAAVERLPEFRAARTWAVFAALPDEPATDEALARWAETRCVVLPRVEGGTMNFYAFRSDGLAFGAFGILEPQGERPCGAGEIDLAVCPAWPSRPTAGGWGAAAAITTAILGSRRSAATAWASVMPISWWTTCPPSRTTCGWTP